MNYVDGTSTLAVMVCWWRPLSGRLFLGRENRLYATDSARAVSPIAWRF